MSVAAAAGRDDAVFTRGSTMRHVVVMSSTGAVGLLAIFAVDLLSLLYISWLGKPALTAGVGLATIVLFFAVSINVGLMIAVGALVSRAPRARETRAPTAIISPTLIEVVRNRTIVASPTPAVSRGSPSQEM